MKEKREEMERPSPVIDDVLRARESGVRVQDALSRSGSTLLEKNGKGRVKQRSMTSVCVEGLTEEWVRKCGDCFFDSMT